MAEAKSSEVRSPEVRSPEVRSPEVRSPESRSRVLVDMISRLAQYAADGNVPRATMEDLARRIRETSDQQIREDREMALRETVPPPSFPVDSVSESLRSQAEAARLRAIEEMQEAVRQRSETQSPQGIGPLVFNRVREVERPGRAHPTDAGIDFYVPMAKAWDDGFRRMVLEGSRNPEGSNLVEFVEQADGTPAIRVNPGGHLAIPSGIRTIIPHGLGLMFVNRSGVATKLKLGHSACLVDADYRDEVVMCFQSHSTVPICVVPGQKIAQGLIVPVISLPMQEVLDCVYEEMGRSTDRGGGFGSSDQRQTSSDQRQTSCSYCGS